MTVRLDLQSPEEKVQNQLSEVARKIAKSRKIVTITGAGISCNAGIPDFRSKKGLYTLVKEKHPDAVFKGKDLFDILLFSNPRTVAVFFSFMAALRKSIVEARPTPTHGFIRHLKDKGKLLRCYTQNIDGLEAREGLNTSIRHSKNFKDVDVIQLHGNIHQLKCTQCSKSYSWEEQHEQQLFEGEPPSCPACTDEQEKRERAGKRYTGIGCLRPNILLYGEEHPESELIGQCSVKDIKSSPDCLIIFGTSLKVTGARKLVRAVAKAVREKGGIVVLVNISDVSNSIWQNVIDFHIQADCDEWVASLRKVIPDFFKVQSKLPKFQITKSSGSSHKAKAHRPVLSPPSTPQKLQKQIDMRLDKENNPPFNNPLSINYLLNSPKSPRRSPRIASMEKQKYRSSFILERVPFKLENAQMDFDCHRSILAPVINDSSS